MKITLNKKTEKLPFNKDTFKRGDYFIYMNRYYLVVGEWGNTRGRLEEVSVIPLQDPSRQEFCADSGLDYIKVKPVEMIFEEI